MRCGMGHSSPAKAVWSTVWGVVLLRNFFEICSHIPAPGAVRAIRSVSVGVQNGTAKHGQSNLAKATSLGSIYSIIFARWQHVSRSWSRLHLGPPFCGRGGRRMSTMVPFKRATVVSYRLSILTVAQSHSAAICHRMSLTLKSTGVGHFGA